MQRGNTTLMVAVEKGILNAVRVALLHKANVEARTEVSWYEAWEGASEFVKSYQQLSYRLSKFDQMLSVYHIIDECLNMQGQIQAISLFNIVFSK